MSIITHFRSPEGELLPIAASDLAMIEVPAAGSTDLGDWNQTTDGAYYMQNTFTDAPTNCAVLPFCTDPSAITDHGLRIEYDEQLQDWVLWIDSLPETACTLTLLFINHGTEDTPCVLPALGIGGGGSESVNIQVYDSVEALPDDAEDGAIAIVPSAGASGSGLTVVELETVATAEGATLTDEENALLNNVEVTKLPFVLKCNDGEATYATIMSRIGMVSVEGFVAYIGLVADTLIQLMYDGGTWTFARVMSNG